MNTSSSARDTTNTDSGEQNTNHETTASVDIVNMDMIVFLLCCILIFVIALLVVGVLIMLGKRVSLPEFSVLFIRCSNIFTKCCRAEDPGLCLFFYDNADRFVECKIETWAKEELPASAMMVKYGYYYPVFKIKMDCFGPYLQMYSNGTVLLVKETKERIRFTKARIPLRKVLELRHILRRDIVYTYFFAVRDKDGMYERLSGGVAKYLKCRRRRRLSNGELSPEQWVIGGSEKTETETCDKESVVKIDISPSHSDTDAGDNDNSQIDTSYTDSEMTLSDSDITDSCSESDDFLATSDDNLDTCDSDVSVVSVESLQYYIPIKTEDGRIFWPDWLLRESEENRQVVTELEKTSDFVVDLTDESGDSE